MKYLFLLILNLVAFSGVAIADEKAQQAMIVETVNSSFSKIEMKVREAAVKVILY